MEAWFGLLRNEAGELYCPRCQTRLAQYAQEKEGFPCTKCNEIFPLLGPEGEKLVLTEYKQPVNTRA